MGYTVDGGGGGAAGLTRRVGVDKFVSGCAGWLRSVSRRVTEARTFGGVLGLEGGGKRVAQMLRMVERTEGFLGPSSTNRSLLNEPSFYRT